MNDSPTTASCLDKLGPLAPLAEYRQFIVAMLVPKAGGKAEKIPVDPRTGYPIDPHKPQFWTDYATAAAAASAWGPMYRVGFVLTEADPFVVVDLDGVRQDDGTWSPLALEIAGKLPGAVLEVSQSGKGMHIWCRHPNPPEHIKKRVDLGIEAYSSKRFIMLGSGAVGEMAPVCTALPAVLTEYFPPRVVNAAEIPDTGPCAEWRGLADDDALLDVALNRRTFLQALDESRVTFRDLWECNVGKLAARWPSDREDFDHSSADEALAFRLAYWVGRDAARVARLMRRSGLVRDKWEQRPDWLAETIRKACAQVSAVDGQHKAPQTAPEARQVPPPPPTPTAASAWAPVPAAAPALAPVRRDYYASADDPLSTVRCMIQRDYDHPEGERLKTWQGEVWTWTPSGWRQLTDADVRAMLYAFADRVGVTPNQSRVSNMVDALKHGASHIGSQLQPPCWLDGRAGLPAREIIVCGNGLLHIPTRTLLPGSPAFFSTNAVPYDFRVNAPRPVQWEAFLAQVWPDDPDAIATLQELFGYLLTPDTSQQKIFLIVGPKRSGKGTIGRIVAGLLGDANITSPALSSLGSEFGLQPLVGKLVAMVSDARLGGRTDPKTIAEHLLRISGEDRVDVHRKFLQPLTLRLPTRFVLLTNELPRLADSSGALASRFIVLKMTQSFYGREDRGLTDRLVAEMPGILNWALDGWQRLCDRGHFVQPTSSASEVEDLTDLGSPILAFIREACEVATGAEVEVDRLHLSWRMWCSDQGIERPAAKPQFAHDLKHAVGGLTVAQPRQGGSRARTYRGIRLKAGTPWHATLSIPPTSAPSPTLSPPIFPSSPVL